VNKCIFLLRAAFAIAIQSERIRTMPVFPKKLRPARPRQGFFEWEDYLAVREALPSWGQDVLDYGFYSGWRRNEILGLTWSEVDLENHVLPGFGNCGSIRSTRPP
jgi:integrase